MTAQIIYDAFTGIGFSKKKALIGFLNQYSEVSWMDTSAIQKAIEYSTKETPSFGGFIATVEENNQIIAALIVNKTGMTGYMPEYIVVLSAILPAYKNSTLLKELKEKAIILAKGDIAMVANSYGNKDMELQKVNVAAKFMKMPLLRKAR